MLKPEWLADCEAAAMATQDDAVLSTIRANPGFVHLLRPWIATWRVSDGDSVILAKALHDIGRFMAGVFALQLHFSPGGLTVSRLSDALQQSGMGGMGRGRSTLIYLRFLGYVEPAVGGDGRTRLYRPTAVMLRAFKTRLLRDMLAFWPAHPAILALAPHFERDEAFGAYIVALGEVTTRAFSRRKPGPVSLDVISHRFGGFSVLSELLLPGADSGPLPVGQPLTVSLSALARDSRTSRAQARSVLLAAERAGFIDSLPDGRYRPTALLAEHLELLLAGTLVTVAYSARRALAAVEAPPVLDPQPSLA